MTQPLEGIRGLLIDLDGVVYQGHEVIPGAPAFFQRLRESGWPFLAITNNSSATTQQFADRLTIMGIPTAPSEVLTSAIATGEYLQRLAPAGGRAFVIGETGLRQSVESVGFTLTESDPEFVIVGLDRSFDYHKLTVAIRAVLQGAVFIGSNPDTTLPAEDGVIPGAGSFQAAIRAATGVTPTVIGKPQPTLISMALERLGLAPREAALIGDRLDTDILGGQRAGVATILVLTGISTRADLGDSDIQPTLVAENLDEVAAALGLD